MPRLIKVLWICETPTCSAELKIPPRTIPYGDEPYRATCPICGNHSLVKKEEIFEV